MSQGDNPARVLITLIAMAGHVNTLGYLGRIMNLQVTSSDRQLDKWRTFGK